MSNQATLGYMGHTDNNKPKPSLILKVGLVGLVIALAVFGRQAYIAYILPYQPYGDISMDYLKKENPRSLTGGDLTHFHSGGMAYEQETPNLGWGLSAAFDRGDGIFERNITPSVASNWRFDADGLGPQFNNNACESCHAGDGRAKPPAGPDEQFNGLFLRVSVPGKGLHGQPMARHPGMGYQIADRGIDGVPAEAKTRIQWLEKAGQFPDGEQYSLRRPKFLISEVANTKLNPNAVVEGRIAPPVFGLGLLEAIPEETILSWADPDDADGDGISGRPNYAWDPERGKAFLGRFGWKANNPSIRVQNGDAAFNDIGLTNPVFRELTTERGSEFMNYQSCSPEQKECLAAFDSGKLEITEAQLQDLTTYIQFLAVPYRRNADDPVALLGEAKFHEIGCVNCHKRQVTTGGHRQERLNNQLINPYTDLLLHDMGEGLAGRPDFEATRREWRTAPLWGIGLTETVNGHTNFLHDGRARSLQEAILWHGGEAEATKEKYKNLTKEERQAIIKYLESL